MVAGLALVVVVDRLLGGELMSRTGLLVVPGTAMFMAVMGMIALSGQPDMACESNRPRRSGRSSG